MVLLPEMSLLEREGISESQALAGKKKAEEEKKIGNTATKCYRSRKNPASLRHFTVAAAPSRCLRPSQWKNVARPPAEQPESRTWNTQSRSPG
jgi:hypothetical protein